MLPDIGKRHVFAKVGSRIDPISAIRYWFVQVPIQNVGNVIHGGEHVVVKCVDNVVVYFVVC